MHTFLFHCFGLDGFQFLPSPFLWLPHGTACCRPGVAAAPADQVWLGAGTGSQVAERWGIGLVNGGESG